MMEDVVMMKSMRRLDAGGTWAVNTAFAVTGALDLDSRRLVYRLECCKLTVFEGG
jgi:hypothetical protein